MENSRFVSDPMDVDNILEGINSVNRINEDLLMGVVLVSDGILPLLVVESV